MEAFRVLRLSGGRGRNACYLGGVAGHLWLCRVYAELVVQGCRVSRRRVARLMRKTGWAGACRRRGARATCGDSSLRSAQDRVERHFLIEAPGRICVVDIAYVQTWAEFLYLAVVNDDPALSQRRTSLGVHQDGVGPSLLAQRQD